MPSVANVVYKDVEVVRPLILKYANMKDPMAPFQEIKYLGKIEHSPHTERSEAQTHH